MRITSVRALCLSRPHEPERQWFTGTYRVWKADATVVAIGTDDGVEGIGEACSYGGPPFIRDWVDWLAPSLVGRDPEDPTLAPHPNGRSGRHDCAVAGIDCALWDLRGKIRGKPVAELLRPGAASRVRLYASSGCSYDWRVRPEQVIDEAAGYLDHGYTAVKVRIGTHWAWDGVTVERFLELMRGLSGMVNGRAELMVDGNQRLTEEQALATARGLEALGFTLFEEPLPQADREAYARLSRQVGIAITGGEQFTTVEQFRPYLDEGCYRVVQPDVGWCGLSEGLRIAAAADRYGVDVMPHNWHNGLMTMANAHYVAALPRPRMCELCMIQGPLQWGILAAPPAIRDGHLELAGPGFGVRLADDLEARFPFLEGAYGVVVER
ncbi:MAG: mandelate racemase/muconate lactonizing enzyme family protein [Armatimonadetes bacterium]|nr:mandelate racemase/muconate lactonizing enzyme family protein [Armatimonadota bacterium]